MNNKLMPVIIDNPGQKGWGYRARDTIITLATLTLWILVMSRLYMFFIAEEAILEKLYSSVMIKLVLIGFVVTFLTFHFWAVYNRFLYTSYLKRQMHHYQQPTLSMDYDHHNEMHNGIEGEVESEVESDTENEIERSMEGQIERAQMREHERVGTPSKASN